LSTGEPANRGTGEPANEITEQSRAIRRTKIYFTGSPVHQLAGFFVAPIDNREEIG
jgi:hypothetical protein